MKRLVLFIAIGLLSVGLCAQEDSTSVQKGKLYLGPLPVIGANPAFGFMYGAACSVGIFLGEPANTSMSSGLLGLTLTTKSQVLISFRSIMYTSNNDWLLFGDWRVFLTSQPTFGLGTGPESKILSDGGHQYDEIHTDGNPEGEAMDFDLIRFYQTGLKRITDNLYAGLGYHLDIYNNIEDHMLDLENDPQVLTNHYTHCTKYGFDPEGYTISGLSLNLTYDSRDNVANPYKGRFATAAFRINPEFIGSDQSSTSLWLEYRDYFSVSKQKERNLIAIWTYANLSTGGQLPYMGLPAIGWDQMARSGRAYPQGRWRGDHMYYAEVEYRMGLPILNNNPDLFGAVVFANVTTASSKDNDINLFQYMEPAAGLGLRIMINKKARTNLTIDYGWGKNGAGALYLNLNEYF